MKLRYLRDIRAPLPPCTQVPFSASGLLIGQQFQDIIDRECPGKLYKLMKQKIRTNWQTQTPPQANQNNPKQIKVFERTFFRQRQRSWQKQARIHSMRLQLQQKLKLCQRPPSPFFKLSRDNILQMQKSQIDQQHDLKNRSTVDNSNIDHHQYGKNKSMVNTSKIHSKSKLMMHPYIKITSKTVNKVSKQMKKKFKTLNQQITQFSPFGSIQPLQFIY